MINITLLHNLVFLTSFVNEMQEEQERKHFPSSVESYVETYDVTEEHAHKFLHTKIDDVWKDINRETLMTKNVPMHLIMVAVNLVRMWEVLYKNDRDNFTHSEGLKDQIESLFIHPMSI